MLDHKLKNIKESITDCIEKITDVYDIVKEYENYETQHDELCSENDPENDDISDHRDPGDDDGFPRKTFLNLYNDIHESNADDADFMKTFGPYALLWNLSQNKDNETHEIQPDATTHTSHNQTQQVNH